MKTEPKTVKASDCKCCVCRKKKAVAFWPCMDPDIPSHPYCRKCLDKTRQDFLVKLHLCKLDD